MTETTQTQTGGCGCGGCGCGAGGDDGARQGLRITSAPPRVTVEPTDLDVRGLRREERHARIFAAVHALVPGEGFVLANDHDPVPLKARLEAEETGTFGWSYLAQGPDVWRVLISRETCC